MKAYVRKFKRKDTSQMGAAAFRDILNTDSSKNKMKTTTPRLMSPGEKGAQRFRETLSSPSSRRRSSSAVQLFQMTLLSPKSARCMSRKRSSTHGAGDGYALPPGLARKLSTQKSKF